MPLAPFGPSDSSIARRGGPRLAAWRRGFAFIASFALLLQAGLVHGDPVLTGRATRVLDGDTIEVLLSSGPVRVRLHSIDAPESKQPWGREARAALERHVLNRTVQLQVASQDRYSRLVADVYVGETLVNAWLVAEGNAWAYRDFLKDDRYCTWEANARAQRLGVWALPEADQVAPWAWRKAAREKTGPAAAGVPPCPAPRRRR